MTEDTHSLSSMIEKEREKQSSEANVAQLQLGKRVREIRLANNLTLEEASRRTGLARSTLSKIENELISPTFQAVQKLASGLNIDIPQLFVNPSDARTSGRRDITRASEGRPHPTPTYEHELLANQLTNKKMMPYKSTVRARSFEEYSGWVRHAGEEFLLILKGSVRFYTEFYEPADLNTGDSAYYDGTMGHALVSTSEEDAEVLWVTSD